MTQPRHVRMLGALTALIVMVRLGNVALTASGHSAASFTIVQECVTNSI